MGDFFGGIFKFLGQYDFATVMHKFRNIDTHVLLTSPITWLITVAVVGFSVLKRQYKYLVLLVSAGLFMFLVKLTVPEGDAPFLASNIALFIAGAVGFISLNFYIFFIREP